MWFVALSQSHILFIISRAGLLSFGRFTCVQRARESRYQYLALADSSRWNISITCLFTIIIQRQRHSSSTLGTFPLFPMKLNQSSCAVCCVLCVVSTTADEIGFLLYANFAYVPSILSRAPLVFVFAEESQGNFYQFQKREKLYAQNYYYIVVNQRNMKRNHHRRWRIRGRDFG